MTPIITFTGLRAGTYRHEKYGIVNIPQKSIDSLKKQGGGKNRIVLVFFEKPYEEVSLFYRGGGNTIKRKFANIDTPTELELIEVEANTTK